MIHTIAEVSCDTEKKRKTAEVIIKKELKKDNINVLFKDSENIVSKDGKTLVVRFRVYAEGSKRKNVLIKIFEYLIDRHIIWGYFFEKE